MDQSSRWIGAGEFEPQAVKRPRRQSSLKFLLRYPILLLAFGPPIFRGGIAGDTSQAHFDFWNTFQVLWLIVISLPAIVRLAYLPSILLPKQLQSILKYSLLLGILFLGSIAYSPGKVISSEFLFLYFLTFICVVEFLDEVYRNPPDWMECLFQLRIIATVILALVILCLPIRPEFVLKAAGEGGGVRLVGGTVGDVSLLCPMIVIISAYSFLHSLEPRGRATLFFLAGLGSLALTRIRGAQIALFIVLAVLGLGWAKTSKRAGQLLIAGVMSTILLAGVVLVTVGGGSVWNSFNRGEDISEIMTFSGRTIYWGDLMRYCVDHPQGLGYIAGIRQAKFGKFANLLHADLYGVGGTDNAYMEVLSDAGWVALALYLVMLTKVVALGWRFAKRNIPSGAPTSTTLTHHALRCSLLLFLFCLIEQMEDSEFVLPLRQAFYIQNILIAIILGASISFLAASRPRYGLIK